MAIVKMKKFTLLTFESKKQELVKQLQNFSKVEFINLQDENILEKYEELKGLSKYNIDSEYEKYEENLSKTKFALEFLKKYVPKKSAFKEMREGKITLTLDELEEKVENSNWTKSYDKLKEKEAEIASLDSQISKLKTEIDFLTPWQDLDVALGEFDNLKETSYFLGTINKSYEDRLQEISNAYIEIISRDVNDINLLILSSKDEESNIVEILRSIGFSYFKTEHKDVPLKIILNSKHQVEELKSKKFFIQEEISGYEEDLKKIQLAYDYYTNKVNRVEISGNFLKTENVATIQGWVAEEDQNEIKDICNKVLLEDYFIEFEDVSEEEIDDVPVKLKNGELVSAFESVTGMYSYPKYNEIDPTPLLTPFYIVFFGMMVADFGYGLALFLGTVAVLKLFNLDDGMKKFIKFFMYLSISTAAFGLIFGTVFGIDIKESLGIGLISPSKDTNMLLLLAVGFGVIQIFFGLGIKAYMLIRDGKPLYAFFDVGSWVMLLVGLAMLVVPSLKIVGIALAVIGSIVIVATQGRNEATTGAKIGQGLYALYGVTSYVGDLVSYTRLMALGIAGGSIAAALNLIIGMLPGWSVIIVGPLAFIGAHIFNMLLSLLGAYVHTARLQYVEYFSKFYDGGGRPFSPLSTINKYITLKKIK